MDRTQHKLASQESVTNVNTDTYLKINLEGSERLLPSNEINHIVDVAKRFDIERQNCKLYKILGTINPTVSNCLFNLSNPNNNDSFTYSVFNTISFLSRSYPEDNDITDEEDLIYRSSLTNYLKEKDGWFGYYDPNVSKKALCNFYDMEPKRERFSLLPDYSPFNPNTIGTPVPSSVKNWELTITYPISADTKHKMVNNGLLLIDTNDAIVSTREMTAFAVACKHNLNIGDTVKITGTNGYDGEHIVVRTGLDNGDLKNYYFVIDIPPSTNILTSNSRIKKIVNGVESEYYFRLFTKIKTKSSPIIETDDYETYQAGFSENFYNDPIIQFIFNEEIDVADLTDNLGRPLSEIFFTMLKTDSNLLFSEVKSGIEVPFIPALNNSNSNVFLRDIPVISKIHNGNTLPFPTHIPLETNLSINNQYFYGDLVEYNKSTLLEVILANVMHRFNTFNRDTPNPINYVIGPPLSPNGAPQTTATNLGPRQEGYYYKAHNLIKIRDLSNYIEEGDAQLDGLPTYSVLRDDGVYIWRDLVPIGFNEGTDKVLDYPFLNNSHYMYQNYCVKLKRQDPYALWGLFYSDFPSDSTGDRITDRFTVKSADNVC